MSGWQNFKATASDKTSFDDVVSGGPLMGVGGHIGSIIQSVELAETRTGLAMLKLTWENLSGQTLRQSIFLMDYNDSNKLSTTYLAFRRALLGAGDGEMLFQNAVAADPSILGKLVGFVADLVVVAGTKGYTVNTVAGSGLQIVDAGSGELIEGIGAQTFASFDDVKDFINELNAANPNSKLYRAYPQISRMTTAEGVTKNVDAIQSIISGAGATGTGTGTHLGSVGGGAI